jgi:hypothetical protein
VLAPVPALAGGGPGGGGGGPIPGVSISIATLAHLEDGQAVVSIDISCPTGTEFSATTANSMWVDVRTDPAFKGVGGAADLPVLTCDGTGHDYQVAVSPFTGSFGDGYATTGVWLNGPDGSFEASYATAHIALSRG